MRIADKTVLKMMRQMGLRCGIRRERPYHRYNSYKGRWGKGSPISSVATSRPMVLGRSWVPMLPSLSFSFGKAYLAPVYDFASKEIVAHSISMCPNLAQQQEMLQVPHGGQTRGS